MGRGERITRPTRTNEWLVLAADKRIAEEWDRWAKQEPNALAAAYDKVAANPTEFSARLEAVHPGHPKETERKRG